MSAVSYARTGSEQKPIPTHDEIRESFAKVRAQIAGMELCLDATIDDYPIGRRERGQCRLQVERAGGKGYRTVRTTTNKHGRWCAPKKSTYHNSVTVVVRNLDAEHQHAWLSVGNPGAQYGGTGIGLQYANGEGVALVQCWRSDPPQRADHSYTTTEYEVTNLANIMVGQKPKVVEVHQHVLKAGPPDEIAAWDVWVEELKTVREMVLATWDACVSQS